MISFPADKFLAFLQSAEKFSPLWNQILYSFGEQWAASAQAPAIPDSELPASLKDLFSSSAIREYNFDFDELSEDTLSGWIQKKGQSGELRVDIWLDKILIASNMPCGSPRTELAGCANSSCGFKASLEAWAPTTDVALAKINLAGTDKTIAFRYYDLTNLITPMRLVEYAEKHLEKGRVAEALSCYDFCLRRAPWLDALHKSRTIYRQKRKQAEDTENWHRQEWAFALMPLASSGADRKGAITTAIDRMLIYAIPPQGKDEIIELLNLFRELMALDDNRLVKLVFENFVSNYIFDNSDKNEFALDFFQERMAFVISGSHMALKFIPDMLKGFPLKVYDILTWHTEADRSELASAFPGIPALDGRLYYSRYPLYILDHFWLKDAPEPLACFSQSPAIVYSHGTMDDRHPPLKNEVLHLYSTYGHIKRKDVILKTPGRAELVKNKCLRAMAIECAYSGPFHTKENIYTAKLSKKSLRSELEKELGCSFVPNRPVLSYISGGTSNPQLLLDGLGYLGNYCNIIYRHFYGELNIPELKLPDNIIYDSDLATSPKKCRFAADYVLADIYKSSIHTCIFFGVPVIPYCDPFIRELKSVIDSGGGVILDGKAPVLSALLKFFPKVFDITKPQEILDAIKDGAYLKWYNDNLLELRKQVFGHYYLEDAGERSAELVLRFAVNGTVGEECAGWMIRTMK